ncbi:MAG: sigma-70 family RNA polymerase sigma factor [Planctomycetes bacterium]|nr:sigma-70 family RNA polymerase sigma factor [Planctomycetota bacterium]
MPGGGPTHIPNARWNTEAGAGRFPTTTWSNVIVARDTDDSACDEAVGRLIEKYWKPVYFYLRRRGVLSEDAKDLTQAFFVYLFFERTENGERRFKKYLHVGKSREDPHGFRKFIKHWLKRFWTDALRHKSALKRGGGLNIRSLDEADLTTDEGRFNLADYETPEAIFDRVWVDVVLDHALSDMELSMRGSGKAREFVVFRDRMTAELRGDPLANKEVARRHGVAESTVSKYFTRGQAILKHFILAQLGETCSSEDEAKVEMRDLFQALG